MDRPIKRIGEEVKSGENRLVLSLGVRNTLRVSKGD